MPRRLFATGFAAALVATALLALRPATHGTPWAWNGDDVARIVCWTIALVASLWLAVVSLACAVAVRRRADERARRVATFAPACVRRMVEAALLVTCVAGTAPAAHAATSPAPAVVNVGPDGVVASESV